MCGRFTLQHDARVYADWFEVDVVKVDDLPPNYNVAPTDEVYAVAEHEGERRLGTFRWGLLPWWAKDRKMAARHINARAETLAGKPAFKDSFARKRCLIPADGFYEWERIPDQGKLPHYIFDPAGHPLAFAGLWSSWHDPGSGERLTTCAIVTGPPDETVRPLHDRMPVMLRRADWAAWLDPDNGDLAGLQRMLLRHEGPRLAEHPVSTIVNDVRNNLAENLVPLRPGT